MLDYQIGQGYSALDAQAWRDKLDGYGVVSGLGVSVDSGLTVSVAAGEATVGETNGSVDTVSLGSATTATLSGADASNPRKDTIYLDTSGAVQVETGTPESALPSGDTQFATYSPSPPVPSTGGVILAEVWVGAGASSLSSSDIRDRRVPADVVADMAVIRSLSGLSSNAVENFEGSNLSVDAGGVLNAAGGYDSVTPTTGNHTAEAGELVFVDASGGGVTITLPPPNAGDIVGVERTDGTTNTVAVDPNSTEQVNYQPSEDLSAQGESFDLVSDGTDWFVI